MSKSCDHYTTMELAAGKQLFKSKLHMYCVTIINIKS